MESTPVTSSTEALHYPGQELELFAQAHNWKARVGRTIAPHLAGDVLEVGAGLGSNLPLVCSGSPPIQSWTGLEPDPGLFRELEQALTSGRAGTVSSRAIHGTLASLGAGDQFDTILYLDVLEHIEDDHGEFRKACDRLRPGGA